MAKNIEINYNSGSGYEVLYPKTIPELTGCLPLTGGTLTGPLTLSGEPSGEMEAVNKGYVDEQVGGMFKKITSAQVGASGAITLPENLSQYEIIFLSVRYKAGSNMNFHGRWSSSGAAFAQVSGSGRDSYGYALLFIKSHSGNFIGNYYHSSGSVYFGNVNEEYIISNIIYFEGAETVSNLVFSIYCL